MEQAWRQATICPGLLVRRRVSEDRQDNPGGGTGTPPLIFLIPLAAGLVLGRVSPARLLPPSVARLVGWPVLGAGSALAWWFGRAMREAGTPFRLDEPAEKLVTAPPFSFSRSPGYLSFALIYAGVACLRNSPWAALMLPGVLLVVRRRVISAEEAYLERAFGDEYRDYKRRVRRWL